MTHTKYRHLTNDELDLAVENHIATGAATPLEIELHNRLVHHRNTYESLELDDGDDS